MAGSDKTCAGQGRWSGDDTTAEPLVNALRVAGAQQSNVSGDDPSDDPDEGASGAAPTISISAPTARARWSAR